MKRVLLTMSAALAALSLVSTSFAAEPDNSDLPAACQMATSAESATQSLAVATTPTPSATDGEDADEDAQSHGSAVSACVAALHAEGEHGIGHIVSEFARSRHGERGDDDDSADASAVSTSTPSTTTPSTTTPGTTTPSTSGTTAPSTSSATAMTPSTSSVSTVVASGATSSGHGHGGKHGHD